MFFFRCLEHKQVSSEVTLHSHSINATLLFRDNKASEHATRPILFFELELPSKAPRD